MLQRHVEENFLNRAEALVLFLHRALDAELESQPVFRERFGRVAMDVAAKLVDQDYQRKPAFGFFCPVIELAFAGALDVVGEFLFDLMIENGIFAEPGVHSPIDLRRRKRLFPEPERQDGINSQPVVVGDGGFHGFA